MSRERRMKGIFGSILVFIVTAAFTLSLGGCELFPSASDDDDSSDSENGTSPTDRPDIPAPVSYLAEVPLRSAELVVATVPLDNFSPRVTVAKNEEGNQIATSTAGERVELYINGNPAPGPMFQGQPTLPVTEDPQLQLVRYWQRLGPVERYSGATTTTIERSVTRGSETTRTESFAYTVGVSTTVSADFLFGSVSTTISAEFGSEYEESTTISESVTNSETYSVTAEQDENLEFAVWQLVDEYRVVTQHGGDWVTYSDPAYEFLEDDLAPLPAATNEIREISYRFPNVPR
jgi:hypothetical protein